MESSALPPSQVDPAVPEFTRGESGLPPEDPGEEKWTLPAKRSGDFRNAQPVLQQKLLRLPNPEAQPEFPRRDAGLGTKCAKEPGS